MKMNFLISEDSGIDMYHIVEELEMNNNKKDDNNFERFNANLIERIDENLIGKDKI